MENILWQIDGTRLMHGWVGSILIWFSALFMMFAADAQASSELDKSQLTRLRNGEILVQVSHTDKQVKAMIEAIILIAAPADIIWSIMIDCPSAPSFVPGLKACQVLESGSDWEIIRHDVKWIWFLPEVSYVFRADYMKNRRIDFVRISGDLQEMMGTWQLDPIDDGQHTVLHYGIYLKPGFFVPQWLVRHSLKSDLPAVLDALRTQVRKHYPAWGSSE